MANVVDLAARRATPNQEPLLTNEERRAIREMLAYYQIAKPQFEVLKKGCPMARRLLED